MSHAVLGAALGALGGAVELGFQARSLLQIAAGVVMIVLAADLLGVRAVRRVVPQPPASWGRLVRRSGHWGGALGPGVLGLATVLIPCGVTLSMEFLAVASGSPVSGAAVMVAFVIGTTPLFAALGYVARRSSTAPRGRLSVLAGAAVLIAGLLSLNAGLTLRGSSFTLSSAWRSIRGAEESAPVAAAPVAADGTQRLVITVRPRSYTPAHLAARAGVPTQLVLHSDGATGCTSAIVFPTLHLERILPAEGDTVINVGRLQPRDAPLYLFDGDVQRHHRGRLVSPDNDGDVASPAATEEDPPTATPRRRRLWAAVAIAVVVVGAVLLVGSGGGSGSKGAREAPAFRFPRLDVPERTVSLSDYRGRPVVVNFWASWCVPCQKEMPAFQAAAADLDGRVAFVGVNEQDFRDGALAFQTKVGVRYPSGFDPKER